jgi:predicted RND superfamily exporter protein
MARDGNMFTPEFFAALRTASDELFFIRGVDRARVQSLFTPNTRYTEVVEDGIQAGNVIPADFQPTPEGLAQVRENILKAGIVGRLVANDFSGAIVSATLQDRDPETDAPLDYIRVAHDLEEKIRDRLMGGGVEVQVATATRPVEVHMIGFAKVVGDIAEGSLSVAMFAGITVVLTLIFVWIYIQSLKVALVPVVCSIVAVIWQLGLLVVMGFGVDPLGILAVHHLQDRRQPWRAEDQRGGDAALVGADSITAAQRRFARCSCRRSSHCSRTWWASSRFCSSVQVIREMAITASLGVGVVILTDLILPPVLVSTCISMLATGAASSGARRTSRNSGPGSAASRTADLPPPSSCSPSSSASPAGTKGAKHTSVIRRRACPSSGPIRATTSTAMSSPASSRSASTSST